MPRKPRIEYEGAFYHAITRGNQRQKIFKETSDYDKYHQILSIYRNRYHFHLYAFIFMGNHVHLLIETGEVPLSKILQGVNQSYTMYFNRKYKTVGHLFQGRYKAILCDRETYLLGLLKYIHENPLRARLVETVDEYRWSSHQAYIGKNNPLSLVSTEPVLRMFSENKGRARKKYLEFMDSDETLKKGDVYATVDQRVQGDENFVDAVARKTEGTLHKEPRRRGRSLTTIGRVITQRYAVTLEQLRLPGKSGEIMQARKVFAQVAKQYGYRGIEIAEYLKKDPASVTSYLQGEEHRGEVQKVIKALEGENVNSKV